MEFIPQREFDTAPEPAAPKQAAEPEKPTAPVTEELPKPDKTEEPPKQDISPDKKEPPRQETPKPVPTTEKPKPEPESGYEKLNGMTAEEWTKILAGVNDALYAAMLEDSTAAVSEDGVLMIHTGNLMLQGMTAKGTQTLEKVLEQASGRKLRVMVVGNETETAAEEKNPAVKELLEKARRLNIDVQIK